MCNTCIWKPEEGIRSLGWELQMVASYCVAGNPLQEKQVLLATELSFQAQTYRILMSLEAIEPRCSGLCLSHSRKDHRWGFTPVPWARGERSFWDWICTVGSPWHMSQVTSNDKCRNQEWGLLLYNVRVPPSISGPKYAKLFQKYELEPKGN